MKKFKKLVLTGAAGRLGSYLREPLAAMCETLVSTDVVGIDTTLENETFVKADLTDLAAMKAVIDGADQVIHFGAIGDERPFETLWGPNFVGAYNVWEAAYQTGVKRVVYASSIHAVGMHPSNQSIDVNAPHRPDTFYGLAKCFAEDLGRMYWEKRGVESVHMRIFSAAPVKNTRSLGTWLSYDDLIQLVQRSVETPTVGWTVVYGISNNDRNPIDNSKASFLGYRPKDNAEVYAKEMLAQAGPADPSDLAQTCLGGPFATVPLGESGVAALNIDAEAKKI